MIMDESEGIKFSSERRIGTGPEPGPGRIPLRALRNRDTIHANGRLSLLERFLHRVTRQAGFTD